MILNPPVHRCRLANVGALLISLSCAASVFAAPDMPYRFIKEIAIGGAGGWDYLSVDSAARRLYVSHATKVVVIDLDQNTVVGEIEGTPGIHGVAVAHDLNRGFTSNGREAKVSVFDLKTLKTLTQVSTGQNPDAILFEPTTTEVYTFNGKSNDSTVFSASNNQVVSTIPLPGKPEFPAYDSTAGKVFVNIEDKSEVAVIDSKTHQLLTTWSIAPGESPSGMAIDLADHLLLIGCVNSLLVAVDSTSGKVVATVPAGEGIDAVSFDPATKLVFTSNGQSGNVTIAHVDSPDKISVVQTLSTAAGARTMTVDTKTHRIYLATAKFEPRSPENQAAHQRPKMIDGTFKVLVYGME